MLRFALPFLALALWSGGALSADHATRHDAASVEQLVGRWEARRDFGPSLSGEISLRRDKETWRAEIAGRVAVGRLDGEKVVFNFGPAESLEIRLAKDGRIAHAQWNQPPSAFLGSVFGSPVRFEQASARDWLGVVTPVPNTITLRLSIRKNEDGALTARLVNPEFNLGDMLNIRSARISGNRLEIIGTGFNASDAERVLLEGELRADDDPTLTLYFGFLVPDSTFDFRRAKSGADEPRPYRQPIARADGWKTGNAADAGVDVEALTSFIQELEQIARNPEDNYRIHGLLIARHGRLIVEEYFAGENRAKTHDTRSASKTVASILGGAVAYRGVDLSSKTPMMRVLRDRAPEGTVDPRANEITFEHLITMSSGLDCDDWDANSPGGEGVMQSQAQEPDWIHFMLSLPVKYAPGERTLYCSGGANLAGAMVREAEGRASIEQIETYLARPLQFGEYQISLTPTGEAYFGGGMHFLHRDLLKFGQLYLNGGVWNGKRILSEDWVRRSMAVSGRYARDVERDTGISYGWLWWIRDYKTDVGEVRTIYMAGNGGQYVFVLPQFDAVVVITGGSYSRKPTFVPRDDYIPNRIAPMFH